MRLSQVKPIPTNTLRTQLARSQAADPRPNSPHPDADQLTAFAENTLLDRERASILTHLAACESCRATLQLAAAVAPESTSLPEPQPRPARLPLRTWLPGVAIAASVLAIAGSSILLYHATRTNAPPTQTARTTSPPPPPVATTPAPALSPTANTAPLSGTPKRLSARSPVPTPSGQPEEAKVSPPPTAKSTPGVISGPSTAPMRQQAPSPPSEQVQAEAQIQAEMDGRRFARSAVKAASPNAAPRQPQNALAEESRSPNAMHGAFMATPAARAHFRINDAGQIERSTDPGIWQPVPIAQPIHFRVLSISGEDIWAGGDRLRLFHSTDNGVTWIEVHLPVTADRTHAIAHIRVDSPQKLTVESDNGDAWTTTDNGATWQ